MAAALDMLSEPHTPNELYRPRGVDHPGYAVVRRMDHLFDQLSMLDHYALLGVAPQATVPQVVRAYERRLMECHPDRVGAYADLLAREQASVVTRRLNAAFQVLSRDDTRRAYDAQLATAQSVPPTPGTGQWDVKTAAARRYLDLAVDAQGVGDLTAARYYVVLAQQAEYALPEAVLRRLHHVAAQLGGIAPGR